MTEVEDSSNSKDLSKLFKTAEELIEPEESVVEGKFRSNFKLLSIINNLIT